MFDEAMTAQGHAYPRPAAMGAPPAAWVDPFRTDVAAGAFASGGVVLPRLYGSDFARRGAARLARALSGGGRGYDPAMGDPEIDDRHPGPALGAALFGCAAMAGIAPSQVGTFLGVGIDDARALVEGPRACRARSFGSFVLGMLETRSDKGIHEARDDAASDGYPGIPGAFEVMLAMGIVTEARRALGSHDPDGMRLPGFGHVVPRRGARTP